MKNKVKNEVGGSEDKIEAKHAKQQQQKKLTFVFGPFIQHQK